MAAIGESLQYRRQQAATQTMLRPFHSLENQCLAERRRRTERSRDASSKAGFLGQLQQLNYVRERLHAMVPAAHTPPPEACRDLACERWNRLPGSAPPPLSCCSALRTNTSMPAFGRRCASAGVSRGGRDARRRRPVHVVNPITEENPALIDFSEEPDDYRVYLPAHRIGDLLPEAASPRTSSAKSPQLKSQAGRNSKPVASKSTPALHIAARRLPLQPPRGGAGFGMPAGLASGAKTASRPKEPRPASHQSAALDAFPESPIPFQESEPNDDEDLPLSDPD